MFYMVLVLLMGAVEPLDLTVNDAAKSVVLLHAKAPQIGSQIVGTGFLVQLPGALFPCHG